MKLNYLIIDDEPIAHTLIENFAADLEYMNLIGNCHNAMTALPLLKTQQIDLIFLDINMPKLTGFEFLKTLPNPPQVIIISAHKEYALESYEYTITDYLLKPFNFERFFKSIQKVMDKLATSEKSAQSTPQHAPQHQNSAISADTSIFIKDDKKHHKVALDDILYIKANGNFTSVYLKDSQILSQMKISDFEKLLPETEFSRVHRSYLIAHHAVTLVSANKVQLGDTVISVGRVYKESVEGLLKK
ncbi:MAG: response regulator transcription factor [Alteromonadaceae bacterium]|nr:response regulator transcription factor [Alteromonadaceae bacterium]